MKMWQLAQKQSLPLELKIKMSEQRIKDWYQHWKGDVYVSFSGGKDSTVLLHLVRKLYPDVEAVFVNTGLEYPEITDFVKTIDNVTWLKPKIPFNKVIEKYGYPVISKETSRKIYDLQNPTENNKRTIDVRLGKTGSKVGECADKWFYLKDAPFKISNKCCDIMKKRPFKIYENNANKKSFIGTMASDSRYRRMSILENGCNAFDLKQPQSRPLSMWLEQDIWEYIKKHDIKYSKIYDIGEKHTGCMFCMFGVHLEKGENRFQRMAKTHPKQYNYCINKLGIGKVLDFINVNYKNNQLKLF